MDQRQTATPLPSPIAPGRVTVGPYTSAITALVGKLLLVFRSHHRRRKSCHVWQLQSKHQKNFRFLQVIQQDNATRKSQRVSIHIVFVTNRLVKSKPGLICSIRSSLEPCTATSDIFSFSRLAEPPLVQSTPQAEYRRHQASIHRPACEPRGPLRKPCSN